MMYTNRIAEEALKLAAILAQLNPVTIVTPSNAAAAKKTWLECPEDEEWDFTNPLFEYDHDKLKEIVAYASDLRRYEVVFASELTPEAEMDKICKDILLTRIRTGIDCCNIAAAILTGNDQEATRISREIYGFPDASMIYEANASIGVKKEIPSIIDPDTIDRLKKKQFDARQIAKIFNSAMNELDLAWPIEISDSFTAIDVQDLNDSGHPRIGIPIDREVDGFKLVRLVGHEIFNHLASSERVKRLFEKLLGADSPIAPLYRVMAKSANEMLYEGAAMVSDVCLGGDSGLPLPWATIACEEATRSDFATVAKVIYAKRIAGGQKEEAARKNSWTTAYRVAGRGRTNTSAPGYVFPKDYAYRAGYNIAQVLDNTVLALSSLSLSEATKLAKFCDHNDIIDSDTIKKVIDKILAD